MSFPFVRKRQKHIEEHMRKNQGFESKLKKEQQDF
jgi:hypothetical protein